MPIEQADSTLQKKLTELEILHEVSLSLSDDLDITKTIQNFCSFIHTRFDTTQFSVALTSNKNSQVEFYKLHSDNCSISLGDPFNFKQSIFSKINRSQRYLYIDDISQWQDVLTPFEKYTHTSLFCIQLTSLQNERIGFISAIRKNNKPFSQDDQELFVKIAESFSRTLEKTLLFQQTKELSITDPLTQLYNRRYFNERFEQEIQRAERYKHNLSVLIMDIDFFKQYNDLFGHLEGDSVLKKIAQVLRSKTRGADLVARFGGEEFVIILPEIDYENARTVGEKLRAEIERTEFKGEEKMPNQCLTISVGFATFPRDAQAPHELLDKADQALYTSKRKGRNIISHLSDQ